MNTLIPSIQPQDLLQHTTVDEALLLALKEDVIQDDVTTQACDRSQQRIKANIVVKSQTRLAGVPLAKKLISISGLKSLRLEFFKQDGDLATPGTNWFTLSGQASEILALERTLLNLLQRSCGIATATQMFREKIAHTNCKILHTRKTNPCLRRIDIYSALVGGSYLHRIDLSDAILVKENHFRSSSSFNTLFENIRRIQAERKNQDRPLRFIEIEVTNSKELKHAFEFRPDRIMLDNFSVSDVAKAVKIYGDEIDLEASGNITLENVAAYAETGIAYISTGKITHSITAADLSLLLDFTS